MADIKEIDYDQMITKASNIASAADDMQKSVKEAFQKIQEMSDSWFGQSYDNFIDTVNMSVTGLNNLFETSVSDIPHEIAAKAKSYASANQATVGASFSEQIALILSELSKTNKGSKLRFRSSEIANYQTQIKTKFENANSCADKALGIAESLSSDWQSISGDSNIMELKVAFNSVKSILSKLSTALDSQITAQSNTIEALENAANNIAAAKEVTEDIIDGAKEFASSKVAQIQQSASDLWTNLTGKN